MPEAAQPKAAAPPLAEVFMYNILGNPLLWRN